LKSFQHPVKKKTNGIHCLEKLVIKCNQAKNKAKMNTRECSVQTNRIPRRNQYRLTFSLPPPLFLFVKLCVANEQRRNGNPVIPIDITPTTRFLLDFLGLLQGSLCKRDEAKRKLYAGAFFVTGMKQSLLCAFLYNYMYVTTVYCCSNIFKLQLLSTKPRDLVPRI
jgi:hypothetical protein